MLNILFSKNDICSWRVCVHDFGQNGIAPIITTVEDFWYETSYISWRIAVFSENDGKLASSLKDQFTHLIHDREVLPHLEVWPFFRVPTAIA